jgi:hypothetical protein
VTDRAARLVLGLLAGALLTTALAIDLPRLSDRHFWNDGATYYGMAVSLAEDGDLRYEQRDLLRVLTVYPGGPQGVFMKRARGGLRIDGGGGFPWIRRSSEPGIYFAKPFLYPAVAAPFVRVLGAPRGLLVVNALFFSLALWLGYGELRRQTGPGRALAVGLLVVLGTVAPLYFFWLTPEAALLGLVTAGLVAWRRGHPLLAAVLLGLATYSKPTNLFLALPLGVEPLVRGWSEGGRGLARGLAESLRRGAAMAAVVIALFGVNWAATGELNYQGGERKTFYTRFPFEAPGADFDNSGFWMTTEHVGPLVEGRDDAKYVGRTAPPRPPQELPDSFVRNLAYFWIGRFGGAVPYFFPAVLAAVLFLAVGPRTDWGWMAGAALVASWLFYIWLIPDNWYGGGGTVGNRYFVNLLPLTLFLVPRGREAILAGASALAAVVWVAPILASPIHHSRAPGDHATWAAYRVFPAELTMLNDLSVFLDVWRKKRPYGDTEGDPATGRRAEPTAYYLYFLDDGTYGQEAAFGGNGFWLRGGETAEVVLRALEPVRAIRLRVSGGPAGDLVTVRLGRARQRVVVGALKSQAARLEPRGRGYGFYDSFVYLLKLESRYRGTSPEDPRGLGAFVQISLEVDDRGVATRSRRSSGPWRAPDRAGSPSAGLSPSRPTRLWPAWPGRRPPRPGPRPPRAAALG